MPPHYHQRYHAHCAGLSGPALRTAIGLTAGLCFVAFGYGQGDVGGLLVEPTFYSTFEQLSFRTGVPLLDSARAIGSAVASWNLGCFLGAAICIFVGDMIGRKGSILLGLSLEVAGKIIQASSMGLAQYIAGRVIAGLGNGFIASTIPSWQAECLKSHQRGTLLMVSFGACITFGVALSYWFVYAFSFTQPSSACWRVPILLVLIFILPCLALITFLPESPRWLILQGREQAAIRALSALNEIPEDSEDVRREIVQIKNAVKYMASAPVSRVFTLGEYRYLHRTLLAVFLQVMQQMTGVNLFMQYLGMMFFNQLKFQWRLALLLAACSSTEFFLASIVAVVGIDRYWGRRTLTMFGAAGMSVSMIILCVMNYIAKFDNIHAGYYVMAVFLFLYNTFFSIGWQGMSWLWSVELIPLSVRGPANAMATAANWLTNFIVVLVTPVMFINTGYRTYITFALTNAAIVPTIYFLFPETGGRSLEEVDILFKAASQKKWPWLAIVKVAREEPRWYDKFGEPTASCSNSSDDARRVLDEKTSPPPWGHQSETTIVRSSGSIRAKSSTAGSRGRDELEDVAPAPQDYLSPSNSRSQGHSEDSG